MSSLLVSNSAPLIPSKPPFLPIFHLLLPSLSSRSLLLLPCLSFLSTVQLCFPVSWFILFCLKSILLSCVLSLRPSPFSGSIPEQRGSFWAAHSATAPLQSNLMFSLLLGLDLLQPWKPQSQLWAGGPRTAVDPEKVLICFCLISLMLMLAAPRLLTKLCDFLFNLAWGLSGPELTVQATFPWWPWPLCPFSKDFHSSLGLGN